MDTTPGKRTKILTLHVHTAKNQREIASIVGVNQSTVSRILKQARTIGTLSPKRKEKCGRKRKTSTRDNIRILRESKKDSRRTSYMLRKDLLSSGVNVSSSTVRRRLIECGRMARRPVKKQLLTANMKKKRLDWAKHTETGLQPIGEKCFLAMKAIFWFKASAVSMFVGRLESPSVNAT